MSVFNLSQQEAFVSAKGEIRSKQTSFQSSVNAMTAGAVSTSLVEQVYLELIALKNALDAAKAVTGIAQYVKDQIGDQNYNAGAKFNAILSATATAITWVQTNGKTQTITQFTDSGITRSTYSTAETAGLVTDLNALITALAAA